MDLIPIKIGTIELDGQLIQSRALCKRARTGIGFVLHGL